jgi:hypothetical protein
MRRPQFRGATAYCEKHRRRYELYRGCGDCEVAKLPPAPPSGEEQAAQRAHRERIQGAVDAALATKGGAHGEG